MIRLFSRFFSQLLRYVGVFYIELSSDHSRARENKWPYVWKRRTVVIVPDARPAVASNFRNETCAKLSLENVRCGG